MSPVDFQTWMFWGLVSQVQMLEVRMPVVEFKHLDTEGEAPGLGFRPNYRLLC